MNRMNRMKYLVSSAVASKTSKGGSKQIHWDSEKKDVDNCKQRWKGLKIGAGPGDQTAPRLSSKCDIHWFRNADDPTYFEATNNLCIIDIVYIALRELHSYFSGAEYLYLSKSVCESGIGVTRPNLHFGQYMKAHKPIRTQCHQIYWLSTTMHQTLLN